MNPLDAPAIELTPEQRSTLSATRVWAERFFDEAQVSDTMIVGGHGYDHCQRVAGMAAVIAEGEGLDVFLPVFTALIFDLGRTSKDPRGRTYLHGQLSAEMASEYVESVAGLSPSDRELILAAVADHPLTNDQVRETYVAKVVMDADRLDTLGALGPVRAATHRWRLPLFTGTETDADGESALVSVYQDFAVRLPKWYDSLWTDTARAVAGPRLKFLQVFNAQFREEASSMMASFHRLGI
jgi:uncharacterized protein